MASSAISLQAPIGVQDNRNKIINGDFNIWQRGVTNENGGSTFDIAATGGVATGAANVYCADRWRIYANSRIGITAPDMIVSKNAFDLGLPSGADNASKWYLNIFVGNTGTEATNKVGNWGGFTCDTSTNGAGATDGGSWLGLIQDIEDVRIFENKTCILSFWAKSDITNQRVAPVLKQEFAGGTGSLLITGTTGGLGHTLDNTWRQYKTTFGIPSIEGQPALGTSGDDALQLQFILHANTGKAGTGVTFELGGGSGKTGNISFSQVQIEQGSRGTEFDQKTVLEEEPKCQRYYQIVFASWNGYTQTNGTFGPGVQFPVKMRKSPAVVKHEQIHTGNIFPAGTTNDFNGLPTDVDNVNQYGMIISRTADSSGDAAFASYYHLDAELNVTTT